MAQPRGGEVVEFNLENHMVTIEEAAIAEGLDISDPADWAAISTLATELAVAGLLSD